MNVTATAVRILASDISVYTYTLDSDAYISITDSLRYVDDQELARANRYHHQLHRDRYLRGRGYLRKLLSWHLQLAPQRVPLRGSVGRKPAIDGNPIFFNVSHSGNLAVCAISRSRPVGIDLELLDPAPLDATLCRQVFTAQEQQALASCDAETAPRRFFEFWTAKEAMMKLTGLGVRLAPRDIELDLDGGRPRGYLRPTLPRAHLLPLQLSVRDAFCHVATPWA